jgi:hypothetical protein
MTEEMIYYVADSIERVGGCPEVFGYTATEDMAAEMITRFPSVAEAARDYTAGLAMPEDLDDAVLSAVLAF